MRIVGRMVFGERAQPPAGEEIALHQPLTGDAAARRFEDAHPQAVTRVRHHCADWPLASVEKERELAGVLEPELLVESPSQLQRLGRKPARAIAITPCLEERGDLHLRGVDICLHLARAYG